MTKKIGKLFLLLPFLFLFSACSQKLADPVTLSGDNMKFSFQLPEGWEQDKNPQEKYGQIASFGAEDTNSNSFMFVKIQKNPGVDMKKFSKENRQELAKVYNYKDPEDLYMNEFELNGFSALKYTVFTRFDGKDTWGHIYYIETENGFVQIMFYSADDGSYKTRSKIIDESARTLKEIDMNEAQTGGSS